MKHSEKKTCIVYVSQKVETVLGCFSVSPKTSDSICGKVKSSVISEPLTAARSNQSGPSIASAGPSQPVEGSVKTTAGGTDLFSLDMTSSADRKTSLTQARVTTTQADTTDTLCSTKLTEEKQEKQQAASSS